MVIVLLLLLFFFFFFFQKRYVFTKMKKNENSIFRYKGPKRAVVALQV